MDHGAKKGGTPSTKDIIEEGGEAHNVCPQFIADLEGPDTGNYLKHTAWPGGKYEVFNARTHETKTYPANRAP